MADALLVLAHNAYRSALSSPEAWAQLLQLSGHYYKYTPYVRLLLAAQAPEATFVARAEIWTEKMGRTLKPGARAIPAADWPKGRPYRLFDVKDTFAPPASSTESLGPDRPGTGCSNPGRRECSAADTGPGQGARHHRNGPDHCLYSSLPLRSFHAAELAEGQLSAGTELGQRWILGLAASRRAKQYTACKNRKNTRKNHEGRI